MAHLFSIHPNRRRRRHHHLLLRPVLFRAVPSPHRAAMTSRGARNWGLLGCSGSARRTTSRMACRTAPASRQTQRGRYRRLREREEPREQARPYTAMRSHSLSRPRTHTPYDCARSQTKKQVGFFFPFFLTVIKRRPVQQPQRPWLQDMR